MAHTAYPASYYAASAAGAAKADALEGSLRCDVCVVGGGYTGLSAALNLAERGFAVVLLEARRIGWGASGRNGGHIGWGFAAEMETIERGLGPDDAKRLFALSFEGLDIIRERVRRHAIACDLTETGTFAAALKPRQLARLARAAERLDARYGYGGGRIVGRRDLETMVRSPRYCGGYYMPEGGHLHPLNYCLGLARAARSAGVRLFERSRVVRLSRGARVRLETENGATLDAGFVVLCANAYRGRLAPELGRRVMPVTTFMCATEPLGAERARALIPRDIAVSDCNFVLDYYRFSADRRLLFGGGVSYSALSPPNLAAVMRRSMLRVFPDLSDLRLDYVWDGLVGITVERTPDLGRLAPTVYYAHGFSGHGVALTGLAGKLIAEAIAGQAGRFDLFARLPHTPFPGGVALRTPLLVLAMLYYRLRDRL